MRSTGDSVGDLVRLTVQGRLDFLHVTQWCGASDWAVAAFSAMNTGEACRKHVWKISQYEDQKNQGQFGKGELSFSADIYV